MSARGTTGMRLSRAASTSGLSACTAEDTTTASAPFTCSLEWRVFTLTPSAARRRVAAFSAMSEPLT
jgi:hypothetical protein